MQRKCQSANLSALKFSTGSICRLTFSLHRSYLQCSSLQQIKNKLTSHPKSRRLPTRRKLIVMCSFSWLILLVFSLSPACCCVGSTNRCSKGLNLQGLRVSASILIYDAAANNNPRTSTHKSRRRREEIFAYSNRSGTLGKF